MIPSRGSVPGSKRRHEADELRLSKDLGLTSALMTSIMNIEHFQYFTEGTSSSTFSKLNALLSSKQTQGTIAACSQIHESTFASCLRTPPLPEPYRHRQPPPDLSIGEKGSPNQKHGLGVSLASKAPKLCDRLRVPTLTIQQNPKGQMWWEKARVRTLHEIWSKVWWLPKSSQRKSLSQKSSSQDPAMAGAQIPSFGSTITCSNISAITITNLQ